MDDIRERYDDIFATRARTPGGFEHEPDRRGFYDVSPQERRELWTDFMTNRVSHLAAEFHGYIFR